MPPETLEGSRAAECYGSRRRRPAVAASMVRGDARAWDRNSFTRAFSLSARSLPGGVAQALLGRGSSLWAGATSRASQSPPIRVAAGSCPQRPQPSCGEFSWISVRNRQASRRCVVSHMPLPGEARPGLCPRDRARGRPTGQGFAPVVRFAAQAPAKAAPLQSIRCRRWTIACGSPGHTVITRHLPVGSY